MTAITVEYEAHMKDVALQFGTDIEAIRLSVEVVCLMRRFGYKVKDDTVLEVIELCGKVAK